MKAVAVVIRPAGSRETEPVGERSIVSLLFRRVIAVPHLDRVEPGRCERFDQIIVSRDPGMGERRDSPGGVNRLQYLGPGHPASWHERRTAAAEETRKRVVAIQAMARRHESIGDGRPADASAAARGRLDERLDVDPIAEIRETRRDLANAPDTIGPLRPQELREHGTVRIQEVSEHMHVARVFDGGDLDPRNDTHAKLCTGLGRLPQSSDVIVIGDRDRGQAGFGSAMHQAVRRQKTV